MRRVLFLCPLLLVLFANDLFAQAPEITSITPTTSVAGLTQVTITGSNFGTANGTVAFGNIPYYWPTSWTNTQIVTSVPANAQTAPVCIQTSSGGLSNSVNLAVVYPTITSIGPTPAVAGQPVTITGTNFGTSGYVTFGNVQTFWPTSWSNTQIVINVPANAQSGLVYVENEGQAQSNTVNLTVVQPSITSISPTTVGAGQQVTITGTNFGSTSGTVMFGSIAYPWASSWSNTQIVTTVPANAQSGPVYVQNSGGAQSNSVSLTVTGAVASLSPVSLTFASQALGVTSAAQTITLTNTGNAVLTLTSIALTGTNPGDFAQTNTCGSSVAAGGNCTISVTFKPTASGTRAAAVSFTDNATGSPQTVSLSGTGTMAVTSVSPASGATSVSTGTSVTALFNESMNASTINTSTFQLLNSSSGVVAATVSYNASTLTATLTPSQALGNSATYTAVITGGSGGVQGSGGDTMAANYSWSFTTAASGTCPCSIWSSTATPGTVDGGDSKGVEIGVHFTSSQAGFITGIRFYKSAANTGTHIGNLWTTAGVLLGTATFSGESASGWQQVNFSSPIAVSANTTYVASYYAPAGHYSNDQEFFATAGVNNSPLQALANTVSPNGVYTYGANSAFPTSTWSASNYWVDVVFNNGTGTGSAPGASLSPTSLMFGNEPVDTTSSPQSVTLDNTGSTALGITSIAFTGADLTDFSENNTCGSSLAAGGTCTIAILFTPAASGARAASLTITDNASGSPQSVALSGTGTHDVILTWGASPTSGVVGYNVYRGTSPGGESSTPQNSTPINGTTYWDENVTAGATYYYVVMAVASNGVTQSAGSNEASAKVPSP